MQPATGVRSGIENLVEQIQALRENGVTPGEQDSIDTLTGQILGAAYDVILHPCDPSADAGCAVEIVPPDPRRCFLPKDEPNVTPPDESLPDRQLDPAALPRPPERPWATASRTGRRRRSGNNDGYYSFSPKPGIRFVALDTITDECGSGSSAPRARSTTRSSSGCASRSRAAEALHQYVIFFGHHTLRTIRFG